MRSLSIVAKARGDPGRLVKLTTPLVRQLLPRTEGFRIGSEPACEGIRTAG
jgi:hypothetical protein